MKRLTPAPFRVVQERPTGRVAFHHRYWVIWEWNNLSGKYEYYLFTLIRARAFDLIDEIMNRRNARAHTELEEATC